MEGPRLTEERLRHHLDTRQPEREGLCLALLPLLGPYSREQPRRPKGGPDGGRDLEALYEGTRVVWGAVGFRNGGGNDKAARDDADEKFRADLKRMLQEDPEHHGFVFFTNVDLHPAQHESLAAHALASGPKHVSIFDFERLRNVLDSPEGLIARLQYLGIAMSPTEQAALVSKFGRELQRVVTTRLDRVERTLTEMEHFMAFQKPVFRIDVYVQLTEAIASDQLGDEIVILHIIGLRDLSDGFACVCRNEPSQPQSASTLVFRLTTWAEGNLLGGQGPATQHAPTASSNPKQVQAFGALSLLRVGSQYVRLIDLMFLRLEAICTKSIRSRVQKIAIDVNGYELFKCAPDSEAQVVAPTVPPGVDFNPSAYEWVRLIRLAHRDCFFDPPRPSGRLQFPMIARIESDTDPRGLPVPPRDDSED